MSQLWFQLGLCCRRSRNFQNCLEGHLQQETAIIEPTGQHIVAIGEEGEEHTVELPASESHPKLSYHLSLLRTEPRFLFLAEVQLIRDPKERFITSPYQISRRPTSKTPLVQDTCKPSSRSKIQWATDLQGQTPKRRHKNSLDQHSFLCSNHNCC